MVFYNVPLIIFVALSLDISCHAIRICPVRLPQNERSIKLGWVRVASPCKKLRQHLLKVNQGIIGIKRATRNMPYDRLNMNSLHYLAFLATNPFLAWHSVKWMKNGVVFKAAEAAYLLFTAGKSQTMTSNWEYEDLRRFYRNHASSPLNLMRGYLRHPSDSQPFQKDDTKWISDHFFAEQRLGGVNPMTIQKITFNRDVGMHFGGLERLLNPKFDLVKAVNKVIGSVNDHSSLTTAIKEGRLFVLYEPLSTDIKSSRDLTNQNSRRHMWNFKAPIAIFASRPENGALTPVAIQMDDRRDSPVYTPEDGDNWMLAKLDVQLTDFSTSQIVEHLCKVHFTVEQICLALERQLSVKHPLYDFMRFHCRGIFTANTLGGPVLLKDKFDLDHILEFGDEGANHLTREAAKIIKWNDLDLKNNIKRRGVNDRKRLPYYPYRDDGLVIYGYLERMVRDYVNAFYPKNSHVQRDFELQRFAREISKDKYGSLRGFPARFNNKWILMKTFTRILWIMTGQHTAINYPQADYASYIPNLPTKMYDVEGVPNDKFTTQRLNNRKSAAKHLFLVSSLSSFRMDRLFDYGRWLKTRKGKHIVNYYKHQLETKVERLLVKRNKKRLEQGHLTYPYFQPSWLTNGVQA